VEIVLCVARIGNVFVVGSIQVQRRISMSTTEDQDYLNEHRNRVYLKIRAALPGDFEQFSHESLTEMIFDMNKGFTVGKLEAEAAKAFEESPRGFMLDMLEEIKKKCDTAIHLLECKKCGIDLPLGERSA
jgi:hypothetical protein